MLTDEQIKALRDGCEGVTPGPWETYHKGLSVCNDSAHIAGCEEETDAAHIARCDPQTIAELCTRVLTAEAQAVYLKSLITNSDPYLISALTSENNDLKARVKVLEGGLTAAIRCAKLALFTIRKQGVMPNSSWEAGFEKDLRIAEEARKELERTTNATD